MRDITETCVIAADFGESIDIYMRINMHDGKVGVIPPLVADVEEKSDQLHDMPPPVMRLHPEDARRFMTELWKAGVRPAGQISGSDTVNAMQSHIDDLQKITFKALDIA